ncbi:hypothetical protein JCM10212_000881 [Sporobolomyces blumeae]
MAPQAPSDDRLAASTRPDVDPRSTDMEKLATGSSSSLRREFASDPSDPTSTFLPPKNSVEGTRFEIEFLLASGKRKRWTVGTNESVERVRDRIASEWPPEWKLSEPPLVSPDSLRLLYLGRFLSPTSLLSAHGLVPPEPGDRPSIVHLHIQTLAVNPTDRNEAPVKPRRPASNSSTCCCCIVA